MASLFAVVDNDSLLLGTFIRPERTLYGHH
jgi:hypothetical protein